MTDSNADRPVDPLPRPPRQRVDPAAMRETLDAARRRLGQAGPGGEEPHSAEQLRALLREAADQAVPLDQRPPAAADPSPPSTEPGSGSGSGSRSDPVT